MKIYEIKKITNREVSKIKSGLKRSKQLTPETLEVIFDYAKSWLFVKDDGKIIGHSAIKKSKREGYGVEIGFIYTYPSKNHSEDEILHKLIEFINNKYNNQGIYAEVLLNPIKRVFKNIGYDKIDEWDSKVRRGNKVELYTNKDLTIISEDNMSKKEKKLSLWNFLEDHLQNVSEETIDVALTDNIGDEIDDKSLKGKKPLKVGVFRGDSKKKIQYFNLPLNSVAKATDQEETDFRITQTGMKKILMSLVAKKMITQEAVDEFLLEYKDKSVQISSDTIEFNYENGSISIVQMEK